MNVNKFIIFGLGVLLCVGALFALWRDGKLPAPKSIQPASPELQLGSKADPTLYDMQRVMDIHKSINDKYDAGGVMVAIGDMWGVVRGRGLSGPEVRAVLRSFLKHPDLRMRFYAARYLFEAGGREGRQELISILNSGSPVLDGSDDIRIRAAEFLIDFCDRESLNDLLAFRKEGGGNPLLKSIFMRFGDVMDPRYAILAKAELIGLDVQGLKGPPVAVDEQKLKERAMQILNGDPSMRYSDARKDRAAWVLALDNRNPEALARLVESGRQEVGGGMPTYSSRIEVLKMLGTIDDPDARAVLVAGLLAPDTAEVCAANLLFCQSNGYEPVKQMVLDELSAGKDASKRVLSYDMKWTLAALMVDDPAVSAAARAADERAGLGDWEHYVVQRRDWPVYTWSSGSVYWYRRTKVEPR